MSPIAPNDPRVEEALSTNGTLASRTLRHALFLERLKTGEANRITKFLTDQVFPDVSDTLLTRLDRMNAGGRFDAGLATTIRYREMLKAVDKLISSGHRTAFEMTRDALFEVAPAEINWQLRVFRDVIPIEFEYEVPSLRQLKSIVTSRPFQGKILREHYFDLDVSVRKRLRNQLKVGLSSGESVQQLVARVRGRGGLADHSRRSAAAIVRTATAHVTNNARTDLYQENRSVIKGVRWLATLDSKTTQICQARDGIVYDADKVPGYPAHWGERSVLSPEVKSLRDLGIPVDTVDNRVRASMDGPVDFTTMPEWIKAQPADVQNRLLGKGIATEVRAGRITVDKLYAEIRKRGARGITLDEVLRLEGMAA